MLRTIETRYYGPDDNHGSRIKVQDKLTGKSAWWHWDFSINWGPDQHEAAVMRLVDGAVSAQLTGETKMSYLWTVEVDDREVL